MKHIGLLMINSENDILERSLHHNTQHVDAFYVLDGTPDNTISQALCLDHPKCEGYLHDSQIPGQVCDGSRGYLLEWAVADHGHDNWFLLLHADELWPDPRVETQATECDGFVYRVPFFIPRDQWDEEQHPFDQLHWLLGPGWPEFRMFKGNTSVAYDPGQHFNTRPAGIRSVRYARDPILHYPYRSPDVQRQRARLHQETGFDPDNYRHILMDDAVTWTDEMVFLYQQRPEFRDLTSLLVAA